MSIQKKSTSSNTVQSRKSKNGRKKAPVPEQSEEEDDGKPLNDEEAQADDARDDDDDDGGLSLKGYADPGGVDNYTKAPAEGNGDDGGDGLNFSSSEEVEEDDTVELRRQITVLEEEKAKTERYMMHAAGKITRLTEALYRQYEVTLDMVHSYKEDLDNADDSSNLHDVNIAFNDRFNTFKTECRKGSKDVKMNLPGVHQRVYKRKGGKLPAGVEVIRNTWKELGSHKKIKEDDEAWLNSDPGPTSD